eukprot:3960210-Pleurochrysis_carterae.AAC.2
MRQTDQRKSKRVRKERRRVTDARRRIKRRGTQNCKGNTWALREEERGKGRLREKEKGKGKGGEGIGGLRG